MKVWKDANEVIKMIHELPSELKNIDREMSKKPNYDNRKIRKNLGKRKLTTIIKIYKSRR